MTKLKIGQKVNIKVKYAALDHRKTKNGIITNINGGYIYVRPMWCTWEAEFYDCELEKIL